MLVVAKNNISQKPVCLGSEHRVIKSQRINVCLEVASEQNGLVIHNVIKKKLAVSWGEKMGEFALAGNI